MRLLTAITIYGIVGPAVLLGTGCQVYAPKPPDLHAHHEAWLDRHPSGDEVQRFAAALRDANAPAEIEHGDDQLTVDQAELVALLFNADLRLARSRAGLTKATAEYAGLWDDPVLNITPERFLSSGPHPWSVMSSVGFTLPISGRLESEKQRAAAAHHVTLHSVYEQEWQVRMNLRRAWIEWSAASLKRDVTNDFLDRLDAIVRIVARMEEVGELARVHGRLFHIELAQRRNELREIERDIVERELAVRQLLGLSPSADIHLTARVSFDRPRAVDDPAATIRDRHPHLQTLLAQHDTSERGLELAIRRQRPDLTIGPGHNYEDGAHRLLLGLSLPLPIFNRNRQQIAEAMAERDHAQATIEAAYETLVMAFATAEVRLAAIHDQHERVQSTIIPLVDQQYEEARRIAELGEVDTLLLLDTLRRQYETKLDLIELEAKRAAAHLRLRELLGPPPDDLLALRRREDATSREEHKR